MPSFSALGGDCNFLAFHLDTFGLLLSTAQCAVVHYVIFNAVRWTYTSIPTPAKVIGNVRAPFLDPKIYWFGSSVWLCEWQELGVEPIFFLLPSFLLINAQSTMRHSSRGMTIDRLFYFFWWLGHKARRRTFTSLAHALCGSLTQSFVWVIFFSLALIFLVGFFWKFLLFFFFFIERKSLKSVVEKDELNLYSKSPFKHSTSLLSLYWMVENPIMAATTGKLSRVS